MAPTGIPDRWLDYPRVGKRISGTNFIAFKVPLQERLCQHLKQNTRFTPIMLMEEVKELSLIIDLTNTKRYYTPEVFTARRIQYQKIFCEGRKVPNAQVVQRFFQTVEDHLRTRSSKGEGLIGVHCTHGVNRTGYLVCRYMIDKLGFNPADAIKEFNLARGANMERENYLECLKDNQAAVTSSTEVVSVSAVHIRFDDRGHNPGRCFRDERIGHPSQNWNVRPREGQSPKPWPSRSFVQSPRPTDQPPQSDRRPSRSMPQWTTGQQQTDPRPNPGHRPAWRGPPCDTRKEYAPREEQGGQGSSWNVHRAGYGHSRGGHARPSPYDHRSSRGGERDFRHSAGRSRGHRNF